MVLSWFELHCAAKLALLPHLQDVQVCHQVGAAEGGHKGAVQPAAHLPIPPARAQQLAEPACRSGEKDELMKKKWKKDEKKDEKKMKKKNEKKNEKKR